MSGSAMTIVDEELEELAKAKGVPIEVLIRASWDVLTRLQCGGGNDLLLALGSVEVSHGEER